MPKVVVSLKKLYDLQNHFRGPMNVETQISTSSHENVNMGTKDDSKYVNPGTCFSPQE